MQLVARAYGTANVHNCSFYCHQASGVALGQVYGSGTASITLDDLAEADLALVAGANPASNHPRLITQLVAPASGAAARSSWSIRCASSASCASACPRTRAACSSARASPTSTCSRTSARDVALLQGAAEGRHRARRRRPRLRRRAHERLRGGRAPTSPRRPGTSSSPPAAWRAPRSTRAVGMLAAARRGIFCGRWGSRTTSTASTTCWRSRTWRSRAAGSAGPAAGLLPIRGHSNVQGVGSVGVTPALKDAFARRLEELYGIRAAERAGPGHLRLDGRRRRGSNPRRGAPRRQPLRHESRPRPGRARACGRIDLTLSVTTKLNEGTSTAGAGRRWSCRCWRATRSRRRRRRNRCSTSCASRTAASPPPRGELRSEVEMHRRARRADPPRRALRLVARCAPTARCARRSRARCPATSRSPRSTRRSASSRSPAAPSTSRASRPPTAAPASRSRRSPPSRRDPASSAS